MTIKMKTKEILQELRKLRELAWLNRGNTINQNNVRTEKDIEDYLNKEWESLN